MESTRPAKIFRQLRRPFLIAEIGGNHEGDFDYAKKLLVDASDSGADAIKFQIYRGDTIVSKREDASRNLHFKKFELSLAQYQDLAALATNTGLEFMASLWDLDLLEAFDPLIATHKVGSGDLTNFPLLKAIALKNKPLLLATAMATLNEVKETVQFIDSVNPKLRAEGQLCLMHCVAMYGEPRPEYAHLAAIRVMQDAFPDIHIGYSDHTKGTYACELALALGAKVLEVHFTDDKQREFRDHHFSIDKDEMRSLRSRAEEIAVLLGPSEKAPVKEIETPERIKEFRRAVYLLQDRPAGTKLSAEMLTTLRPNVGIDARSFFRVIGRSLNRDKRAFEALYEADLTES